MVTNFEFYKDEILKITRTGDGIAFRNGKLTKCQGCDCVDCEFTDKNDYSDCNHGIFEWLYAEHVEAPKLTKRERAFCEAVQTGWIARDEDGELNFYRAKPKKLDDAWGGLASFGDFVEISGVFGLKFGSIKWEDETPWAVEDLLKLEVQE